MKTGSLKPLTTLTQTIAFATEATTLLGTIDVVVNSLTSPGMVAASLAALCWGGAWVEVGKRDIWSPTRIAQERPDVMASLVAIDFAPPPVLAPGMQRIAALLAAGGQ